MTTRWLPTSEAHNRIFRITLAFIDSRLEDRQTVNWALGLGPSESAQRAAVLSAINQFRRVLSEPWGAAWRAIEEAWGDDIDEDSQSIDDFQLSERLKGGERSGALVRAIVDLLKPGLHVTPNSEQNMPGGRKCVAPKSIHDLIFVRLSSGKVVDPSEFGIETVLEVGFLEELAHCLDASVLRGIHVIDRVFAGFDGVEWRLGDLRRVYHVPMHDRSDSDHEPDEFSTGIAPASKMLHAVVRRLCTVSRDSGLEIIRSWRESSVRVRSRIWCALARDPLVASDPEVTSVLAAASDKDFWDLQSFPELAELRAVRFGSLDKQLQVRIARRIRKGPPLKDWPRRAGRARVAEAREFLAAKELRRIELSGSTLPASEANWLKATIGKHDGLAGMARVIDGFLETPKAFWVAPNPDSKFDLLLGEVRLRALEAALATSRSRWDDDNPAGRAGDWIQAPGNARLLIPDFESSATASAESPRVWERFGWSHGSATAEQTIPFAGTDESSRVLLLLGELPVTTLFLAIDGISHWMSTWSAQHSSDVLLRSVWERLWPLAVRSTNEMPPNETEGTPSLSAVVKSSGDSEPQDLDTLNTSAGKLVGSFLRMCPNLNVFPSPFLDDGLREVRDALTSTTGRSLLIVHHRLTEHLAYFLAADRAWAEDQLVRPLLSDTPQSVLLWRAVARKTRYADVLTVIGGEMARRTVDGRLGRTSRQSLLFSLDAQALLALYEGRDPAVAYASVQQAIRSVDDEVRAHAATTVAQFVQEYSGQHARDDVPVTPEMVFEKSAKPYLETVWPQERPLATPGVAKAFARIPAACGQMFAAAVSAVERFLVPFDCWSMLDYGLYGEDSAGVKLQRIDTPEKAAAFLRLLDATIAPAERGVVPTDLGSALAQIVSVAPRLSEEQSFRRLSTLTRR